MCLLVDKTHRFWSRLPSGHPQSPCLVSPLEAQRPSLSLTARPPPSSAWNSLSSIFPWRLLLILQPQLSPPFPGTPLWTLGWLVPLSHALTFSFRARFMVKVNDVRLTH